MMEEKVFINKNTPMGKIYEFMEKQEREGFSELDRLDIQKGTLIPYATISGRLYDLEVRHKVIEKREDKPRNKYKIRKDVPVDLINGKTRSRKAKSRNRQRRTIAESLAITGQKNNGNKLVLKELCADSVILSIGSVDLRLSIV